MDSVSRLRRIGSCRCLNLPGIAAARDPESLPQHELDQAVDQSLTASKGVKTKGTSHGRLRESTSAGQESFVFMWTTVAALLHAYLAGLADLKLEVCFFVVTRGTSAILILLWTVTATVSRKAIKHEKVGKT